MTLVRFNQPHVANRLANRAWFESFLDSNSGNHTDCKSYASANYEITDNETNVELEMAIPGLTKDDLSINLENEVLTIKTKDESIEGKSRFAQAFEKRFKVTNKIDVEKISASVENGILNVLFPKVDEAIKKPARTIEIA